MATHKFAVGHTVRFSPDRGQEHEKGEFFKIVRLLPEAGGVLQYRVRSEIDNHERVVREDQLECKDRYANHCLEACARSLGPVWSKRRNLPDRCCAELGTPTIFAAIAAS